MRRLTTCVLALSCLGFAGPARAGELLEALKGRQARIDQILKRNPGELSPAEKAGLEDALAGAIDFQEMARSALAEWDARSPAERDEYVKAFEDLIRKSLMRRVDIYRIEGVTYGAERVEAGRGRVDTVVRSRSATTEVRWDFVRSGKAGWRISDYAIDGVSTARNYRTQFARILARSGWPGLLDRIRKRAREIEEKGEKG